jgi:hypothetical protein
MKSKKLNALTEGSIRHTNKSTRSNRFKPNIDPHSINPPKPEFTFDQYWKRLGKQIMERRWGSTYALAEYIWNAAHGNIPELQPKSYKCLLCGKEIKRIDNCNMFGGGIVDNIEAGYGSVLDGNIYTIAICDDCVQNNKDRIIFKKNYIDGRIEDNR